MKFLGECGFDAANAWQDKLKDEDIFPTIEEVGGYFGASFATMGELKPRMRLYVEDDEFEKAVKIIKELEQGFEKKVEIESKGVNQTILMAVFIILCIFVLFIFSSFLKR